MNIARIATSLRHFFSSFAATSLPQPSQDESEIASGWRDQLEDCIIQASNPDARWYYERRCWSV